MIYNAAKVIRLFLYALNIEETLGIINKLGRLSLMYHTE